MYRVINFLLSFFLHVLLWALASHSFLASSVFPFDDTIYQLKHGQTIQWINSVPSEMALSTRLARTILCNQKNGLPRVMYPGLRERRRLEHFRLHVLSSALGALLVTPNRDELHVPVK